MWNITFYTQNWYWLFPQLFLYDCLQFFRINYFLFWFFVVSTDVDECRDKKACQCPECSCKNTWGSYECTCSGDLLYIRDHDTCISQFTLSFSSCYPFSLNLPSFFNSVSCAGKRATEVRSGWTAFWIIIIGLAMASVGAYLIYRYRLRVCFLNIKCWFPYAIS